MRPTRPRAIESGARWQADAAVFIDGADHIVFDGIDTKDTGPTTTQKYQFGYRILNAVDVTIRNVRTENHGVSGLLARNSRQIYFRDNVAVNCGTLGEAGNNEIITIHSVDTFEVTGNTVAGGGREGIDAKVDSTNGLIRGNTVYNTDRVGIYLDAYDGQLDNVTVTRNEVYGTAAFGITIGAEVAGGVLSNVTITNNLVYNNAKHGINFPDFLGDGFRSNVLVANNTVYHNGYGAPSAGHGGIVVRSTNTEDIRIRNNIVADNKAGQIGTRNPGQTTVTNNVSHGSQFGSYWGPTLGSPGLNADPLFENAANANFRLQNNSPAKDYGTSTEAPIDDFTAAWRMGPNDAGAYEGITALTATASEFGFWGGTYGNRSVVSVNGLPFSEANQVNVTTEPSYWWQIGVSSGMITNVQPGDKLRVTFWARVTSGTGQARVTFQRTDGVAPHSLDQSVNLTTGWQKFSVTFDNTEDTSGAYLLAFNLGEQVQNVQIGGVELITYGPV